MNAPRGCWCRPPRCSAVLALDSSSTTLAQSQGDAPSALTGVVSSADGASHGRCARHRQAGGSEARDHSRHR